MLYGREKEISLLDDIYNKSSSDIVALFGRHKIGKTTLLNSFMHQKLSLYLCAIEMNPVFVYKSFLAKLSLHFNINLNKKNISTLAEFLELICEQNIKDKLVVVLDNFQNILKIDKNALKDLDKVWNRKLKNKNIMLVISSSIYSSTGDDAKIYGKFSKTIKLNSFEFSSVKHILPDIPKNDEMYIYSSFGTNPLYLKEYNVNKDFISNIKEKLLSKDSHFFEEGMNILKKDLSDISTYASILHAIAVGNSKIGDIADFLNLKSSYLTRYLQRLVDLMLISKEVPIDEDINKSKFGRYKFDDKFLKFWFCYVYPHYSFLQENNMYQIVDFIRKDFSKRLVQSTYKEYILERIKSDPVKFIGFNPTKIGSWWNNKENELDIIAFNNKNITFIECQWRKKDSVPLAYEKLKNKASVYNTPLSKNYILFIKSGMPQNHMK